MRNLIGPALLGLTLAGAGLAPALSSDATGCESIDWKQQILVSFEGIEDACQEVIIRDGAQLVRFKVKFVRARANGDVDVKMYLSDGTRVDRTFSATDDFRADSESGKTHFRMNELQPGDVLDVYIPMSRVVVVKD